MASIKQLNDLEQRLTQAMDALHSHATQEREEMDRLREALNEQQAEIKQTMDNDRAV